MLMDQPNDCELYQEWLSTPYQELEHSQQSALEHHLLNCSACALYEGENDHLCSLLDRLPVPDMETGLPPPLEELLQRSREEEVGEQLATRDSGLLEEGEYPYHTVSSRGRDCTSCLTSLPDHTHFCPACRGSLKVASHAGTLASYEKIPTVPLKFIDMSGYSSAMHPPRPMRYPVYRGVASTLVMLGVLITIFSLSFMRLPLTDAHGEIRPSLVRIEVYPDSLSFIAKQGGSNPVSQSFVVTNYGEAGIVTTGLRPNYGLLWLSVSPGGPIVASGHLAISVSVDTQSLSVGQYTGVVYVTLTDTHKATSRSMGLVFVSLIVTPP